MNDLQDLTKWSLWSVIYTHIINMFPELCVSPNRKCQTVSAAASLTLFWGVRCTEGRRRGVCLSRTVIYRCSGRCCMWNECSGSPFSAPSLRTSHCDLLTAINTYTIQEECHNDIRYTGPGSILLLRCLLIIDSNSLGAFSCRHHKPCIRIHTLVFVWIHLELQCTIVALYDEYSHQRRGW